MSSMFLYLSPLTISGVGEFPPELPTDRGPPVRHLPLPAAHLLPADPQHHLPGGHHDGRGGQAPVLPGGGGGETPLQVCPGPGDRHPPPGLHLRPDPGGAELLTPPPGSPDIPDIQGLSPLHPGTVVPLSHWSRSTQLLCSDWWNYVCTITTYISSLSTFYVTKTRQKTKNTPI